MIYTLTTLSIPLADKVTFLRFTLKAESLRPNFVISPTSMNYFRTVVDSEGVCVVMDALNLTYLRDTIRNFTSKRFSNTKFESLVFYGISNYSVTRIITYAASENPIHTFEVSKDLCLYSGTPIDFFHTVFDNEELAKKQKLLIILPEMNFHESFISVYAPYIAQLLQKRREGSETLLVTFSCSNIPTMTKRLCAEICQIVSSFSSPPSVTSIDLMSKLGLINFLFSETDAETFEDWSIEYMSGRPGKQNLDLLLMVNDSFQTMKTPYFSESGKIECRGKFKQNKSLKAGETVDVEFLLLHDPDASIESFSTVEDILALSPCSETIDSMKRLPELLQAMSDYRLLVQERKLILPSIVKEADDCVVTKKILSIYEESVQFVKSVYNLNDVSTPYYGGGGGLVRGRAEKGYQCGVARGLSYTPANATDSFPDDK